MARALERDDAQHGAPLVQRMDLFRAHDAPAVPRVLKDNEVLLLHGPPHYPCFYGQLERRNREYRASLGVAVIRWDMTDKYGAQRRPAETPGRCGRTARWRAGTRLSLPVAAEWLSAIVFAAVHLGCGSTTTADAGTDAGGTICAHMSDCAAGTTCIAHACVATTPCTSSRMCPGLVCDTALGACVECVTDAACATPTRCRAGVCEPPPPHCTSDRECSALGLVCDVAASECVECNAVSDCDPARYCTSAHTCAVDVCMPGARGCVVGGTAICNADGGGYGSPTPCASGSGCAGGICVAGVCASDANCDDATFCDGVEHCTPGASGADAHGCVAGAAPCMTGTVCNEATRACDTDCASSGDADGDGHQAIACGGNDCDDTMATVHPGATEVCNGRDDNCDGAVDEEPAASAGCPVGQVCTAGACAAGLHVVALGVGFGASYAALSDGSAWAWGQNGQGQLGDGTTTDRAAPVAVSGIHDAVDVQGGSQYACALRSGGGVRCWGYNPDGRLGNGAMGTGSPTPVDVVGITDAVQLSVGYLYACVRRSGGRASCWGHNPGGECGGGSVGDLASPRDVGLATVTRISAGFDGTCAIRPGGEVWCWGSSGGIATTTPSVPQAVTFLSTTVADGAAGTVQTQCITTTGVVKCWGDRPGLPPGPAPTGPPYASGIVDATDVAGGYGNVFALTATGHVRSWGLNDHFQLGHTGPNDDHPMDVGTLTDATLLAHGGGGSGHRCALRATGGVVCWGTNTFGELGGGASGPDSATPVAVVGLPP